MSADSLMELLVFSCPADCPCWICNVLSCSTRWPLARCQSFSRWLPWLSSSLLLERRGCHPNRKMLNYSSPVSGWIMGIIDPRDKKIGSTCHQWLWYWLWLLSLSLCLPPSFCCQCVNNRSLSVGHICMSPVLCYLIELEIAPLTVRSMAASEVCWSQMYMSLQWFVNAAVTYEACCAATIPGFFRLKWLIKLKRQTWIILFLHHVWCQDQPTTWLCQCLLHWTPDIFTHIDWLSSWYKNYQSSYLIQDPTAVMG